MTTTSATEPGAQLPVPALTAIDGGWRVKLSDDGRHHLDVIKMLYNWRLVTTPVDAPTLYSRGWCYYGHKPGATMHIAFRAAVLAAFVWDGADETEPAGYDKRVGG